MIITVHAEAMYLASVACQWHDGNGASTCKAQWPVRSEQGPLPVQCQCSQAERACVQRLGQLLSAGARATVPQRPCSALILTLIAQAAAGPRLASATGHSVRV